MLIMCSSPKSFYLRDRKINVIYLSIFHLVIGTPFYPSFERFVSPSAAPRSAKRAARPWQWTGAFPKRAEKRRWLSRKLDVPASGPLDGPDYCRVLMQRKQITKLLYLFFRRVLLFIWFSFNFACSHSPQLWLQACLDLRAQRCFETCDDPDCTVLVCRRTAAPIRSTVSNFRR